MKAISIISIVGLLLSAGGDRLVAQDQVLPEVTVVSRNYKYLKSVNSGEVAQPVKLLQQKAAAFDVKNSEYYEDDYDTYFVTFYLPQGYILAVYDTSGKLIRTAERFKNVDLPAAVRNAVVTRYPNWAIGNDIYVVRYEEGSASKMIYKMVLQNGSKRLKVKLNDKAEFLD